MNPESPKYIPLPVGEVPPMSELTVDVYVRLGDGKYVLVARRGDSLSTDRLNSYKQKGITHFFVMGNEYSEYVSAHLEVAGILVHKDDIRHPRENLVTAAARAVLTEIEHLQLDPLAYEHARAVAGMVVDLIETHRGFSKLLQALRQADPSVVNHSVAVAGISIMMGYAMGWEQRPTLEKLGLGSLLHDIGKAGLPEAALVANPDGLGRDNRKLYESHCRRGAEMARQVKVIPDDVVSIILEHHELANGTGFPQGLKNMRIHPLARVVSLANRFAHMTIPQEMGQVPLHPIMAIEELKKQGQPFNKDCFKALETVVTWIANKAKAA